MTFFCEIFYFMIEFSRRAIFCYQTVPYIMGKFSQIFHNKKLSCSYFKRNIQFSIFPDQSWNQRQTFFLCFFSSCNTVFCIFDTVRLEKIFSIPVCGICKVIFIQVIPKPQGCCHCITTFGIMTAPAPDISSALRTFALCIQNLISVENDAYIIFFSFPFYSRFYLTTLF